MFEAQRERGVEYLGQEIVPSRSRAAELSRAAMDAHRSEASLASHEVMAASRVTIAAPRALQGQEKQMLFRDSDTGAMAAMPVFETLLLACLPPVLDQKGPNNLTLVKRNRAASPQHQDGICLSARHHCDVTK